MKHLIKTFVILTVIIALLPALPLLFSHKAQEILPAPVADEQSSAVYEGGELLVFDKAKGEVIALSEREYTLGALLCEMPASYEIEALKAQAVACHTYALHVKALREKTPDESLKGAYFSVDSSALSGYMDEAAARGYFGESFEEYYTKAQRAVDETLRELLYYDNAPIAACYHAISPGRTENSEVVFSSVTPYLTSVDSSWDKKAEGYESVVRFTPTELSELISTGCNDFVSSGDPSAWLGTSERTDAGTVTSFSLCSREFRGTELREYLGLRSAAFECSYLDGMFVFTVHGYGHGVGMSQNGANELAKTGADYRSILSHYYTGAALTSVA